jgi:predicted nucleic acid-binding protein
MSRVLSELLDEPEVVVESVIKKLEHMSGWESTDVRLLAEVNNRVRTKMSELGLDADDTTGHELFHALRAKLEKDEASINLPKDELIYAIAKAHKGYEVYALKNSVAKDLLRIVHT